MRKLDINVKVLFAIIVLFGLSLSLMAQPYQKQEQYRQEDRCGVFAINLTDEQKTEIKEIHMARMKETQTLSDEVKINKAKINALLNKENPDMKEIVSLVEANGKMLTQIQIRNIESNIKVRVLLTDEQKLIFDARKGKMQKNRAMAQHKARQRTPGRCRF
ncbi:Spy/CpxP family protein refolding chaperone [Bacteroidota bacterium]